MSDRLHVVIGIIINADDEVLITQRQAHQELAGLWEFPGGKCEPFETTYQALQRELEEELGIVLHEARPWLEVPHDYPQKSVLLDIWQIQSYSGVPMAQEGQGLCWCPIAALSQYTFPEPNRAIIEKLHQYIIEPYPNSFPM